MGTASDTRLAFFANLLSEENTVTIVNRYASKKQLNTGNISLNEKVIVRDILNSKDSNGIKTIFLLLLSVFCEPFCLLKINRKQHIDILHVYSGHYIDFLCYWVISRLIGAKVVYQYVEYRSKIVRSGLYHKVNGYLCDFQGAKLWDGCISISTFLQDKAFEVKKGLKQIKVTPLCEFRLFDNIKTAKTIGNPYLLFCGSVRYKEPLELIIESYQNSVLKEKCKLVLILSGPDNDINRIKQEHPDYIVTSRIPYSELIEYYKGASILLIPLRSTIQDIARFPNKICEYTASHGAILTTNNGEIRYYFKDGENAIVADEFAVNSFREKMDDIANGKYNLELIRKNAYILGRQNFSIIAYREPLNLFFNNLLKKSNN